MMTKTTTATTTTTTTTTTAMAAAAATTIVDGDKDNRDDENDGDEEDSEEAEEEEQDNEDDEEEEEEEDDDDHHDDRHDDDDDDGTRTWTTTAILSSSSSSSSSLPEPASSWPSRPRLEKLAGVPVTSHICTRTNRCFNSFSIGFRCGFQLIGLGFPLAETAFACTHAYVREKIISTGLQFFQWPNPTFGTYTHVLGMSTERSLYVFGFQCGFQLIAIGLRLAESPCRAAHTHTHACEKIVSIGFQCKLHLIAIGFQLA